MPNEQDIEKSQVKAQVEEPERSSRAEVSQPLMFDSLFETVYVSTEESVLEEQPADETPQAEKRAAKAVTGADSNAVQSAGLTAPTPSDPRVSTRSDADVSARSDPADPPCRDSAVPPHSACERTQAAEVSQPQSGAVPPTEMPTREPVVSYSEPDAFFGFDLMATIGIAEDAPAEKARPGVPAPGGSPEPAVPAHDGRTEPGSSAPGASVQPGMPAPGGSLETRPTASAEGPASASGAAETAFQPNAAQPGSGATRESDPASILSAMPAIPSALRAPAAAASPDALAPAAAGGPTEPTVDAPPDAPALVAAAGAMEAAIAPASETGNAPVDAVDVRSTEPSRRRTPAESEPVPASKEEDAVSAAARAAAVEWRRQKGRANPYSDSPKQRIESSSAKAPAESARAQRRGLAEPDGSPRRTDAPNGDRVRAAQPAPSGDTRASVESGGPHVPAERSASPETTAALPIIRNGRHAREHADDTLAQSAQRIRAAVASVSGVPLGDELRPLTKDTLEGSSKPLTVTPESAEQEHAAQKSGAQDPDTQFFAATMSIEEGMEKADKVHARNVKMWTRVAAAMLLVVVGGVGLTAAFSLSLQGGGESGEASPPAPTAAPSAPDVSGKAVPVVPEDQAAGEKATGKAGTVVYSYTGHVGEGGTYVVTETVDFADDGTSAQTTIEGTFGNAATAEQFLEAVKRDYGSDFLEGTAEGERVVVKVDISKLGLDREAYEDALRDSVDDLRVVKKS